VDDVLDKLFSVLPVVLVILWVMRRMGAGARKSAARKTAGKKTAPRPEAEGPKAGRSAAPPAGLTQARRSPEAKPAPPRTVDMRFLKNRIRDLEDRLAEQRVQPYRGEPGEDDLYDKIEGKRIPAAVPPPQQTQDTDSGETQRTVEGPPSVFYETGSPGGAGLLERLDSLSPLARGMVWSFILERPPSLKSPAENPLD
jgi:hypothetical protein